MPRSAPRSPLGLPPCAAAPSARHSSVAAADAAEDAATWRSPRGEARCVGRPPMRSARNRSMRLCWARSLGPVTATAACVGPLQIDAKFSRRRRSSRGTRHGLRRRVGAAGRGASAEERGTPRAALSAMDLGRTMTARSEARQLVGPSPRRIIR
eukprot:362536-Chlamydomonas_euryale.AAC.5